MPGQPQQVGRPHPGEHPHILVQRRPQQPGHTHRRHRNQKKSGGQAPPLAQSGSRSVPQGGPQGAKVGGSGGDSPHIAVNQKAGNH